MIIEYLENKGERKFPQHLWNLIFEVNIFDWITPKKKICMLICNQWIKTAGDTPILHNNTTLHNNSNKNYMCH